MGVLSKIKEAVAVGAQAALGHVLPVVVRRVPVLAPARRERRLLVVPHRCKRCKKLNLVERHLGVYLNDEGDLGLVSFATKDMMEAWAQEVPISTVGDLDDALSVMRHEDDEEEEVTQ